MNYSSNPASCEVVIFKERGKYYDTLAVVFEDYEARVQDEFAIALRRLLYVADTKDLSYEGMVAVCMQPCNRHSFPLMLRLTPENLGLTVHYFRRSMATDHVDEVTLDQIEHELERSMKSQDFLDGYTCTKPFTANRHFQYWRELHPPVSDSSNEKTASED